MRPSVVGDNNDNSNNALHNGQHKVDKAPSIPKKCSSCQMLSAMA
jgi:hypothetical protein